MKTPLLRVLKGIHNCFKPAKPMVIGLLLLLSFEGWSQLDTIHYFPPIHSRQNSQIAEQYIYLSTPEVTPFVVTVVDGAGNLIGTKTISKDNPDFIYVGSGQWPATDVAVPLDSCAVTLKASGFIASAPYDFYCNVRIKAANQATSVSCKGRAALGKTFYTGSMPQVVSNSNRNFITSIMATENGTIVNVTGYNPGVVFESGGPEIYADALTLILNAGDCYVMTGYTTTAAINMTGFIGAKISSNKNIAVNTGNYMGSIHTEGFQDGGMVQIVPTYLLGTEHAVVEGEGGSVMERPLVVAIADGTQIFLNDIVAPVTTINEGEYYLIPESYFSGTLHRNMVVKTSTPAYLFQCTAANTSSATSEFNYIPPLACYLSEGIDAIPDIDRIGPTPFTGYLYIITTVGSAVTVNGSLLSTPDGPEPAVGLPDWETYKLTTTGDVRIESTGAMAAGYIAVNGNAAAGAYYAGFNFDFQVDAGPDLELCIGEEALLYGTGAGDAGVYTWDGGVLDSVAFVPGATMIYHVYGTNIEGCEDDDSVLVTVYDLPTSNAGPDEDLCDTNATTLNGNLLMADGFGLWTMVSGPSTPTFVDDTDPATDIEDLVEGTYELVWTVGNGTCPTVTDTVILNVYDMPVSNAGADQNLCDTYETNLEGNPPVGLASGIWSFESGPSVPTFSDVTDPSSLVSDLVEGSYLFIWTLTNGTCPPSGDTVTVNVYDLPTSTVGGDQNLCAIYSTDLTGNVPAGTATGLWFMEYGPSTPTFADDTDPTTTVSGLVEGTYSFIWMVNNGTCPAETDTLLIHVFDLPVSNAGPDQEICEIDATTLSASVPAGSSTGSWSFISGPSVASIADPLNPATSVSGLMEGTYTFVWTVSNGTCLSVTDTVLITLLPYPEVDFIAPITGGCEPLVVSFTNLSTPVGDDCFWEFGDGGVATGCGDVSHTYSPGVYNVTLTVTAGGCTSSKTEPAYITVVPLPEANFTLFPEKIDITNTSVEFRNHSENATIYRWSFGDGTGENGLEEPTHVFPETINATYQVRLIAENDLGCADTAYATVAFEDLLIFYVPNTFTPDGSGTNDAFSPVFTSRVDPYDFNMKIFNRWGELIFETYNMNIGWNGTYNDVLAEDGVYVWAIEFGDTNNDKKYSYKGHVNLLR